MISKYTFFIRMFSFINLIIEQSGNDNAYKLTSEMLTEKAIKEVIKNRSDGQK